MNRQMVQIDVNKKLMMTTNKGIEFTVKKIVASRGTLITDVSILGEDRNGQVASCTYLLADAPDKIRAMVNEAFTVAFSKGA